jgi:UDP-N-acetylglucosamine 4,6-dehydratase
MRILVTGASGFFGRGFVREALNRGAERICIYSRGEYAQALMRQEFDDDRLRWFIGDVRDESRLEEACESIDLIVHAAALKRIEVGRYNPGEMYKTNIDGTRNVITAARRVGVDKVVFVSSDKAFEPCSPYGISKAAAECAILSANNTRGANGPIYAAVRYGNVFNSTGSIVPTWRDLISKGAKVVPVTDPTCTRFFMRREEAVRLVWDTAETMEGGELAIPDLPAFDVGSLAEAMRVGINVTGLPSHEKKHESMSAGVSSDKARRMSVAELREELSYV